MQARSDAPAASQTPSHFNWIDALRGIAALAVVVYHYHHFYLRDDRGRPDLPPEATFPYAAALEPVYLHGALAVQLFWVISGFVFMHVYLNRPTTARQFWVARVARLYPLHVITLFLVAGLQALNMSLLGTWQIYGSNDLRHFLLHLVFASNSTTLSRGLSFNGPIWSVSLEIGAYALFFLALAGLKRFRWPFAAGLTAAAFALAAAPWFDPPLIRVAVFTVAGYFFFGVTVYFLFLAIRTRPAAILGAAVALGIAAGLLSGAGTRDYALASGSAALVLLAGTMDRLAPRAGLRLRPLGDISYSLYLVHVPLQMLLLTAVDLVRPGDRGFADSLWLLPAYVAVCCLVAHLVYRHVEVPLGRRLRRAGGGQG